MNVFEKLKDYRKIDFNIYVDNGMITHTQEHGYNEYTIVSDRIEFAREKDNYKPTFDKNDLSKMNINIYVNNRDGSRSLEVITSPYIISLNVEAIRHMAPIYSLGSMSPSYFSRGRHNYKIKLSTTINIETSRLMFKIDTSDTRIYTSNLSHSILGTPFTVSDNDGRWRINGTEMRGVLSYE